MTRMYTDRSALIDWRCERGDISPYPYEPAICPFSGCGSRIFARATEAEAREFRRLVASRAPAAAAERAR